MIVQEEQIREALNMRWQASVVGDANAEHDIYADDAICDYPQSGERILGRSNLQALRVITQASQQVSASSEFSEKVTSGHGIYESPIRDGQHTQ
jgi:hypothetical protein